MGKESHYSSKKDRVFVRGIQGQYSLKDELARLRGLPRVIKGKGAPIDWFSIGTAIARPNGVGVARRAPHPHAAVLFYDFEIGEEGQKILAQRDFVPTNRKIDTPLNKLPLKFVDARVTLDEYDKWVKLYEEIFGKGR